MAYSEDDSSTKRGNAVPTSGYDRLAGERLSTIIESLGGLKPSAEIARVTPEQLAKWRDGRAKWSFFGISALCARSGRSMDWLGGLQLDSSAGRPPISAEALGGELTLIPRYDVRLSSGRGAMVSTEDIVEHLAFRTSWLQSMRISPKHAALVTNEGRSNLPLIPDGALLLLDLSKRQPRDGRFFAIRRDGELLLKQVQRKVDGAVVLKAFNTEEGFEPEEIPPERVEGLKIIGQLMWFGRSI